MEKSKTLHASTLLTTFPNSLRQRKMMMTQTSPLQRDIQDEIKETFTSLSSLMTGEDLATQQCLQDLKNAQETAFSCLKEILAEVEERERLFESQRIAVEREIQNVKTSQVENATQISDLERGMKMHEEVTCKLNEIPKTVIGQHSEELLKAHEATYTDMENRRQEGEMTKQELQCRLDKLEKEVEEITRSQDQLQNANQKEKLSRLKEMNELVIMKTFHLVSAQQRQKEEDHSKILYLKEQLKLRQKPHLNEADPRPFVKKEARKATAKINRRADFFDDEDDW